MTAHDSLSAGLIELLGKINTLRAALQRAGHADQADVMGHIVASLLTVWWLAQAQQETHREEMAELRARVEALERREE